MVLREIESVRLAEKLRSLGGNVLALFSSQFFIFRFIKVSRLFQRVSLAITRPSTHFVNTTDRTPFNARPKCIYQDVSQSPFAPSVVHPFPAVSLSYILPFIAQCKKGIRGSADHSQAVCTNRCKDRGCDCGPRPSQTTLFCWSVRQQCTTLRRSDARCNAVRAHSAHREQQ